MTKMTDYGEEQKNELEAIESIYPDSFTGMSSLKIVTSSQLALL